MVLLQLKDPLELFVKRREFPRGYVFLSRHDMTQAVVSDVRPIILSFLTFLKTGSNQGLLHIDKAKSSTPAIF